MKKIFLFILLVVFSIPNFVYSAEEETIVVPKELNFTERFYLNELKELRSSVETLKREIFAEIQNRELWTIDKALSYSSNAVSFFSILITILITSIWIVWWKTMRDIKNSTKESMYRETRKIIDNFQEKIALLEKEQKINIYWRQYNSSESDKEKMTILDKIYTIRPESQYAMVERSNVYLSMWIYEKVIEITNIIISSERRKHLAQALINRAAAYAELEDIENSIKDLKWVLSISSDYKDNIIWNKHFENIIKTNKFKELLK